MQNHHESLIVFTLVFTFLMGVLLLVQQTVNVIILFQLKDCLLSKFSFVFNIQSCCYKYDSYVH